MDTLGITPNLRSLQQTLAAGPPFAEQLQTAGQRTWAMAVAAVAQFLQEQPQRLNLLTGGRFAALGTSTNDPRIWHFQKTGQQGTTILLSATDPLADENFALIVAPRFCLVLCHRSPLLQFSFAPAVVQRAREALRRRLTLSRPDLLGRFDRELANLVQADSNLLSQFSRHLLSVGSQAQEAADGVELDFLELLAHEVRTPLTTIRTLTRLLLKRPEFLGTTRHHLELIDRECTLQVERFELLSMALDHEQGELALHPQEVAVDQLLINYLERWREQADLRGLALDLDPPQELLTVRADQVLLERVLGGLVDRLTRSLPFGSHIQVKAERAGLWLRLQIEITGTSHSEDAGNPFRVDTNSGAVTLRLPAAQGLVAAMGGKLTLRLRPDQEGSTLTLYLPILS
jgi:signal transduction histidine kinase